MSSPVNGVRIGEAASLTGVSIAALRAWERRYGFLTPKRNSAGHRLYSEVDIERIGCIKGLIASGMAPGNIDQQSLLELSSSAIRTSLLSATAAFRQGDIDKALALLCELVWSSESALTEFLPALINLTKLRKSNGGKELLLSALANITVNNNLQALPLVLLACSSEYIDAMRLLGQILAERGQVNILVFAPTQAGLREMLANSKHTSCVLISSECFDAAALREGLGEGMGEGVCDGYSHLENIYFFDDPDDLMERIVSVDCVEPLTQELDHANA